MRINLWDISYKQFKDKSQSKFNKMPTSMITKQQLIDNGISEKSISNDKCFHCNGILVGQKPLFAHNKIDLVCVDCGRRYTPKED